MNLKWFVSILFAILVFGAIAGAEDIKNDSGCDVCDGAIHFGPEETRKILGEGIHEKIKNMWWQGQKSVWVDLDGVLINTEAPDNESPFEIKIYGTMFRIFVKSLMDGSVMELVLDKVKEGEEDDKNFASVLVTWDPEIFLYAGHDEPIDLTDSLDVAWKKITERHIFQWMSRGKDIRASPEEMRKQVWSALEVLAP